jgi:mono/diheme cytochrome c family protein
MPNYKLSEEEVNLIVEYFDKQEIPEYRLEITALTAFSMAKAERYMEEKLSCLGCHQLGEKGGRIGPDLSNINARLMPEYINKLIRDPHNAIPDGIMPKPQVPPQYLNLIIDFLLQHDKPVNQTEYLSLIGNNIILTNENNNSTESTYLNYCASCHGATGNADGFNARYLADLPTRHADATHMSLRPDDTLFDGVYAGGYILNKSQLMPAYGHTLNSEQILELVKYMRTLCDCTGPGWSTDNQGPIK